MNYAKQDDLDQRGDEELGERERWDRERYIKAAHDYIMQHPDEWDELLTEADGDWREHYRSSWRAMYELRDTVALQVAHLLEVGDL